MVLRKLIFLVFHFPIQKASTLFLTLGFFGLSLPTIGQQNSVDSLYLWFDTKIGMINSGLYKSREFVEEYLVINDEHRFFDSPNYLSGTIWYQGRPFHQVLLKYDLYEEHVIVSPRNVSNVSPILLEHQKIDSFSVQNRKFIKIAVLEGQSNMEGGFFELLKDTPHYTLFKKHRKTDVRKMDRNRPYYEFKDRSQYVIKYGNAYHSVKSRKDVLDVFPVSRLVRRRLLGKNTARILTDDSILILLGEIGLVLEQENSVNGL